MSRKTISQVLIGIVLFSSVGCSSLKIVYSRLDWIVPYTIDDYISLNKHQRVELDKELRVFLDWHCTNVVKKYAQWLRDIRTDVENNTIDTEKISHYIQTLASFWQDIAGHIGHKAEKVLYGVEQSQIDELFENLAKKNLDYQRDFIDLPYAELRLKLVDVMQARFEKWLGELTEEQIAAISVWSYGATKRTAGWVKSRLIWQQALHDVLSLKQERKQFANSLFVLLRYPERLWTESYKWEREMGKREIKKLLYAVYLTLLPRQSKHLLQQLDSWSDDIDSLSCDNGQESARRDADVIDISVI